MDLIPLSVLLGQLSLSYHTILLSQMMVVVADVVSRYRISSCVGQN